MDKRHFREKNGAVGVGPCGPDLLASRVDMAYNF